MCVRAHMYRPRLAYAATAWCLPRVMARLQLHPRSLRADIDPVHCHTLPVHACVCTCVHVCVCVCVCACVRAFRGVSVCGRACTDRDPGRTPAHIRTCNCAVSACVRAYGRARVRARVRARACVHAGGRAGIPEAVDCTRVACRVRTACVVEKRRRMVLHRACASATVRATVCVSVHACTCWHGERTCVTPRP